MSADNWAVCPRCVAAATREAAAERGRVTDLYGHVPLEEFMREQHAMIEAENAFDEEGFMTFREDYEVWSEGGRVRVSYSGHCGECDLGVDFKAEKRFWEPEVGPQ